MSQPQPLPADTRRPPRRLLWCGPLILAVAVGLYVAEYTQWHAYVNQIDLMVYRFGGLRVLDGKDLYSKGIFGSSRFLLFTYTPFAALTFTPLSVLSLPWLRAASLAVALALLTFSVHRTLTALGVPRRRPWWSLTALAVGLCLWLEPVRYSIELGQVNLLILAAVTLDLLAPPGRKWAGVAIGVVAGIKLTPAIFLVFLLLIGRRRAALVGAGTFAATVLLSFAILPADSTFYWLRGNYDAPERISPDPTLSSSVRGLFGRLHWPTSAGMAVAIVVAVLALAVAVVAWRRGHVALGLSLVGLGGAAASPFSWTHHWVWFVPLLVHLAYRGCVVGSRAAGPAMWLLWAVVAGWLVTTKGRTPVSGLARWRPGGAWNQWLPSEYVYVLIAVLAATAAWLWRTRPHDPERAPAEHPSVGGHDEHRAVLA
ncbi:glycosyltransferase 87 family protein [Mycolicibacterium chubuense]|uniref:glycosyltransferase 87 family protein n=1 Tax=Mycolicibacterium chubuense TaxID=1800 RepID=UPI0013010ACE|nr:glycosyltransferase 87 family protein [Mycolicibacterium chubuense]